MVIQERYHNAVLCTITRKKIGLEVCFHIVYPSHCLIIPIFRCFVSKLNKDYFVGVNLKAGK